MGINLNDPHINYRARDSPKVPQPVPEMAYKANEPYIICPTKSGPDPSLGL